MQILNHANLHHAHSVLTQPPDDGVEQLERLQRSRAGNWTRVVVVSILQRWRESARDNIGSFWKNSSAALKASEVSMLMHA